MGIVNRVVTSDSYADIVNRVVTSDSYGDHINMLFSQDIQAFYWQT